MFGVRRNGSWICYGNCVFVFVLVQSRGCKVSETKFLMAFHSTNCFILCDFCVSCHSLRRSFENKSRRLLKFFVGLFHTSKCIYSFNSPSTGTFTASLVYKTATFTFTAVLIDSAFGWLVQPIYFVNVPDPRRFTLVLLRWAVSMATMVLEYSLFSSCSDSRLTVGDSCRDEY